jgi:carboxyl-terminal processing protease
LNASYLSVRNLVVISAILFLAACGGGGGGSGNSFDGAFLDANAFAQRCQAPRAGTNPATNQPYPDIQGSTIDENNFLRSYSNDTYLWYNEITDRDPGLYSNTRTYFDLLKTTAITSSGQDKDKFHFTVDSNDWYLLSQSGVSPGYGAQWVLLSTTPPRKVLVAYTEPNTPATVVGLERGAEILEIDGVDINGNTQADIDAINAGLFPSGTGELHTFMVRDPGALNTRSISMTSSNVTSAPVQDVKVLGTPTGRVGYLVFNDHIATAEEALVDAVNQLNIAPGIDDLILDLRYNGGGFLAIASQLAYMIAGAVPTAGRTFETMQFNDKHPFINPVTGGLLSPTPFYDVSLGFGNLPQNQALPTLNLSRVFVITGSSTCSASEAIINSLLGVDVEVIQIGSTTCGKPYGFYPTDNCGTTYFTIQFRGVNQKSFGDYSDGFSPANQAGAGTLVQGCSVADDFTAILGDPVEGRLAATLNYRDFQSCPAATGVVPPGLTRRGPAQFVVDGIVPKSPWLTNRIMRRL